MKDLLETEEGQEWARQTSTRRAAKEWETLAAQAHVALNAACRESTDPKVRAAYERFTSLQAVSKYLNGVIK